MTSAEHVRSLFSPAENALVSDEDVARAVYRATLSLPPRTRVEVAALLVLRGPASPDLAPLAALPLQRPVLQAATRLRGSVSRLLDRTVARPVAVRRAPGLARAA